LAGFIPLALDTTLASLAGEIPHAALVDRLFLKVRAGDVDSLTR